jgi:hypothetical protein
MSYDEDDYHDMTEVRTTGSLRLALPNGLATAPLYITKRQEEAAYRQ